MSRPQRQTKAPVDQMKLVFEKEEALKAARAEARANRLVAARPFGGQLLVDTFVVSASGLSESEDADQERSFEFRVLFSDEETYEEVCADIDSYLGSLMQLRINHTFGENKWEVDGEAEPVGDVITDPRKFPARIHAIFTCDGIEGDIEDNTLRTADLRSMRNAPHEIKQVDSLYGYKAVKWNRLDYAADIQEDEDGGEDEDSADDGADDGEDSAQSGEDNGGEDSATSDQDGSGSDEEDEAYGGRTSSKKRDGPSVRAAPKKPRASTASASTASGQDSSVLNIKSKRKAEMALHMAIKREKAGVKPAKRAKRPSA